MTSSSILWRCSLRASNQCLWGKNDSSYWFVFIPTAFINDESEAVDVELPMVTADNDGTLASQILKTGCHNIRVCISILVICLNRNTMAPMNSESIRTCPTGPPNSQVIWVPCVSPMSKNHVQEIYTGSPSHALSPIRMPSCPLVSVKMKIVLHQVKWTKLQQKPREHPFSRYQVHQFVGEVMIFNQIHNGIISLAITR